MVQMKPATILRIVLLTVGIGVVASWWCVERALNSVPSQRRHEGSVALLTHEPATSERRITLTLATGIQTNVAVRHLQIEVVVCGGSNVFRGLLLVTGDSVLSKTVRLTPNGLKSIKPLVGSGKTAQVFAVSIPHVQKCFGPVSATNGSVEFIGGETLANLTEPHRYGPVASSRTWVGMPAIGVIPGINQYEVGRFQNPVDSRDKTDWFRTAGMVYRVRVENPFSSTVEYAEPRPTESYSTGTVDWKDTSPFRAAARVSNQSRTPTLQSWSTLLSILLGISTSVLASAAWSLGAKEDRRTVDQVKTKEVGTLGSIFLLILIYLVGSRRDS
jgi:hypothetical protein